MKTIKITYGNEIPENYTGIVEFEHGYKCWRKNGKYHREDGPARILVEGYKQWWLDGVIICHFLVFHSRDYC